MDHRNGSGPDAVVTPARLAYVFYAAAATGAVLGQAWVAVTHIPWPAGVPAWLQIGVVLPFALCLELLGMATAALADERMRGGERAYGFRVLSGGTAVVAIGVIVVGHWPNLYLVAGFGALSAAAYALWLMHSAARRRDALRLRGQLAATAPAYGLWRWLRRPVLTARARELAREHGYDLYGSLREAGERLRAEARRPAIAAAVERVVRGGQDDPRMAEIAARTLDLDRIAAELEARADYAGWAERLAPAVAAHPPRPAVTDTPSQPATDTAAAGDDRAGPAVTDTSGGGDAAQVGVDTTPDIGADMPAGRRADQDVSAATPGRTYGAHVRSAQGAAGTSARPVSKQVTPDGCPPLQGSPTPARVVFLAGQYPDLTRAQLAQLAGCSERHVRRCLAEAGGHHQGGHSAMSAPSRDTASAAPPTAHPDQGQDHDQRQPAQIIAYRHGHSAD